MKLIELKKINIGYGHNVVCKDINLTIEQGQYICVVGENGSGKSTLLKTILGLNKALSGKLIFSDEADVKGIGYLPQQTEIQRDFPATVMEIVMSGFLGKMGIRPFYNKAEKEKASLIVKNLDIEELVNKSFKELSGGQQQRVLLARALCATDNILVMDEPVNALDARSIKKFYQLIKKLNVENGLTIIMVSHNLDSVIDSASHIIYLKDKMEFAGTKEEFLTSSYAGQFGVGEK